MQRSPAKVKSVVYLFCLYKKGLLLHMMHKKIIILPFECHIRKEINLCNIAEGSNQKMLNVVMSLSILLDFNKALVN